MLINFLAPVLNNFASVWLDVGAIWGSTIRKLNEIFPKLQKKPPLAPTPPSRLQELLRSILITIRCEPETLEDSIKLHAYVLHLLTVYRYLRCIGTHSEHI